LSRRFHARIAFLLQLLLVVVVVVVVVVLVLVVVVVVVLVLVLLVVVVLLLLLLPPLCIDRVGSGYRGFARVRYPSHCTPFLSGISVFHGTECRACSSAWVRCRGSVAPA
jgi:hypothetical protein